MNGMSAVTIDRSGPRPGAFWRLWTANGLSNLGDGLYQFALPLLALEQTRSPSLIAGVTLALTLAWPVFGLHAGGIVDRFDRRRVLLGVGLLRVATLGLLTVALALGQLSLPLLYLAALVLGLGETLADTALTALVPTTVPAERLEWANGRITAGQSVANSFVGPPLAGVLLGIGGSVVTAAATGLYAAAAVALATLRAANGSAAPIAGPGSKRAPLGVTDGLRFLWRDRVIRKLTLFTAAMNFWWSAWAGVFVLFAVAPGPLGLTPAAYGSMVVAMAIGGIAGSLACDRIARTIGVRNALLLDVIGTALLVGVPALTSSPVVVGLANVGAGVGSAIWIVLVASIRQRRTPNELLGRVYSASRLISWGILPIGAAFGGLAAEIVGIRTVFLAGGVTSIVLAILFVILVPTRDLARPPAVA